MTTPDSSSWPLVRLSDCADILSGGTPFKGEARFWGGSIPWVSAKDMKIFRLHDARDHVTPEGADNGTRIAPAGSTLVLVRGMTLHDHVPVCWLMCNMAFNQDVKAVVPKSHVHPEYLAYWLAASGARLHGLVDAAGHGTGRIAGPSLHALPVRLPPLEEQRLIAHSLGAVDRKIELNRRMNGTLESIARAIFKSWFIDFDPVRQKMYGGDTRLPPALAALFPDSLRESSLGVVPEGWVIGTIEDLFVLQRGFDLPKELRTSGPYPVLTASGLTGFHSSFAARGPGVVTGRSGRLGGVWLVEPDFWPLNTVLWVKEFRAAGPLWTYQFLQLADLERFNSGSAVPTLNRNHVHLQPALVPPASVVSAFERLTGPLFARRRVSLDESVRLSGIRDAVVPRLLSGGRIDQQPVRHSDEW